MNNQELQKKLEDAIRRIEILEQRRIYRRDVAPKEIKQDAIDGIIIFRGLAADRPSNGDTEIQAYYSTDDKTLAIWNDVNEAWETEVLT